MKRGRRPREPAACEKTVSVLVCEGPCPACKRESDEVYLMFCTHPSCGWLEVCCPLCASEPARQVLAQRP